MPDPQVHDSDPQDCDSDSKDCDCDPKVRHSVPVRPQNGLERWTLKQETEFLSSTFNPQELNSIHSFHRCKHLNCNTLSATENSRFSKKGDRFHHQCLMCDDLTFSESTGVNWLMYKEGDGMFCLLCRKQSTINTQNKSTKYSLDPAVRYKRKAVEDHAKSKQHAAEKLSS